MLLFFCQMFLTRARARVYVCVIHWHCTAQLSMFNMEKRFRNKIIIITPGAGTGAVTVVSLGAITITTEPLLPLLLLHYHHHHYHHHHHHHHHQQLLLL